MILRRLKKEYRREDETREKVLAFLTNFCNLRCFSCSTNCDVPNSTHFNSPEYEMSIHELETALINLKDFGKNEALRFVGGEPTLNKNLVELSKIARKHDRRVEILTNGARIMEHDPFLFDYILLDQHKQNKETIKLCVDHFKRNHFENFEIKIMEYHQDLNELRKGNISPCARCPMFMNQIAIYRNRVYPCCVFPPLLGWEKDENEALTVDHELSLNYSVYNENLYDAVINWREYLPDKVFKICAVSCWRGANPNKTPLVPTDFK